MINAKDMTNHQSDGASTAQPKRDYRRLWIQSVAAVGLVSVVPLLIMTGMNYYQYKSAIRSERTGPVTRLVSNLAKSLEFFLVERQSALNFLVQEFSYQDLIERDQLEKLLSNLKIAFGGFVDLGVIDSDGIQVAYAGPYALEGQAYGDQDWYHEVRVRGAYTSEVFMGLRHLPHFVIAIQHDAPDGQTFILRASIDTETLDAQTQGIGTGPTGDAFVVNNDGVLQTPSWMYGETLDRLPWAIPPFEPQPTTTDMATSDGEQLLVGYAYISHSPFILVLVNSHAELDRSWLTLRRTLVLFLGGSVFVILTVVTWGVTGMIRRIRDSDTRRAALLHQIEYTNRMAAIGRLAAGVAHEVNNPLAIINEKGGLMQDLLTGSGERPSREKLLRQVESILNSVNRCATITHRLLGFAKHMDVRYESVDLPQLLEEVFGFLERESRYRNVTVQFHPQENLPQIVSDRGQLQQVFLNILNNALAAIEDGGRVDVRFRAMGDDSVAVSIADDGHGISQLDRERIFEPFFSTKGGAGSGLGLSITYGIVEKLGGRIQVESEQGRGTTFTVVLSTAGSHVKAAGDLE